MQKQLPNFNINETFQEAFIDFIQPKSKYTTYIHTGGRSSGKSELMLQKIEALFHGVKGYAVDIVILRSTKNTAKNSISQAVRDLIINKLKIDIESSTDKKVARSDINRGTIKFKFPRWNDGKMLYHSVLMESFSKDKDTSEKLKGLSKKTHIFIDELKELDDPVMFRQLTNTVRRTFICPQTGLPVSPQIICSFNTPDSNHWITREYFSLKESKFTGYYIPVLKTGEIEMEDSEDLEEVKGLKYDDLGYCLTYSNIFTNEIYKQDHIKNFGITSWKTLLYTEFLKYKTIDPYHYYSEILGLVATGRSGQVYTRWKEINEKVYNNIDGELIYGIDFGFSQDYTSVVEIKVCNIDEPIPNIYFKPIIYEKGLLTPVLASKIIDLIPKHAYANFYADIEPRTIAELQSYGIKNIKQAYKHAGSREMSATELLKYNVYYVEKEVDMANRKVNIVKYETDRYHWLIDKKTGNSLNKPSDGDDHLIDSLKMPVYTHFNRSSDVYKWNNFFKKMASQKIKIL